jgi:hypothetical protein
LAGLGFFLGETWGEEILKYLHWIILGFITLTTFSVVNTYLRLNKEQKLKKLMNEANGEQEKQL